MLMPLPPVGFALGAKLGAGGMDLPEILLFGRLAFGGGGGIMPWPELDWMDGRRLALGPESP
jgi:hypothetical protein